MFKTILASIKLFFLALPLKIRRRFLLPAKPHYINFAVTYKCNSRCRTCLNWQRYLKHPEKIKQELTTAEIKNFFLRSKNWLSDLKHIGIAGGEPFLREDLLDLIAFFRNELPQVSLGIQTNGLLPEIIEKKLKEIVKIYPMISLAVSLDGEEKNHDLSRGIDGGFNKVMKTIGVAKKIGVQEISAGMTVTDRNCEDIRALKNLTKELGVNFSFYPADSGDYYNVFSAATKNKKSVAALIKALNDEDGDYFNNNLKLQLQGEQNRTLPCYSGWTSYVLDPYGEIKPCVLRSESFGNIKNESLGNILNGKKAKEIRGKISNCRSCWSICEVTTSAMVDPWGVLSWFIVRANKIKFIKNFLLKRNKIV